MSKPTIKKSEKRTGKRIVIGLLTLLVLAFGTAWAFGWIGGTNPALAEVQQLQSKLSDPALKEQDRRAAWGEMRQKMDSLSEADRASVREAMRQRMEKRMNDHMKEVLAMSKADQLKALDADIDRMRKREADRAANQAKDAKAGADGKSQQANGRQRNRGGYRSDADQVSRIENRLDRTSPESRANRTQYMQLLNQRLQQRGLPPMTRRFG
jgi:hypothetical protein